MNEETDMLTEEQDCPPDFSFNQPSVNNFYEMEENDCTWHYMEEVEQEILQ
jgi:hypothetical protein